MSLHEAELTSGIDNKQEQIRLPNHPKDRKRYRKMVKIHVCFMKECSTLLIIREIQMKTNATFLPSRLTKIRK